MLIDANGDWRIEVQHGEAVFVRWCRGPAGRFIIQ